MVFEKPHEWVSDGARWERVLSFLSVLRGPRRLRNGVGSPEGVLTLAQLRPEAHSCQTLGL